MANTKVPVELFDAGAGFTIGSGAEEDIKLIFDGNATDYYIGLRDSGDKFVVGKGQTLGTDQVFEISDGTNAKPQVGVGSGGTNPMNLTYTGTALAVSESSGTASVQVTGGNAARMDFGIGNTALFRMYTDSSNYTEFKRTTNHPIIFNTNNTEIGRFLSTEFKLASGKKLVGGGSSVDFTIQSEHRTEIIGASKGTVILKDQGTAYALFERPTGTSDFDIQNPISDGDITFVGNDGGSNITAMTIDMSEGGTITTPNGDNGLGLGTATVPHGGVGAAKLAIEGSDSNFGAGPHVQFTTTSDDHPLMQILPYAHDNVSINFDAYHDGTSWTSSDAGSNFSIYKLSDALNFYYKSGIAAGSAISSWQSGAYLSATSGQFGVGIGLALNAGADIQGSYGNWTGEKSAKLQFHGGHFYIQTTNSLFFRNYNNGSGNDLITFDNGGNIVAEGNITAYGSVSDERLKENIEVIDNAIDKVNQLKGVTFNYKKDGKVGTGLIAQDLEKVLPEAVYTAQALGDHLKDEKQEEHLAINYGNTVGLLVEAIKELSAKIEKLEGK